jgi:protease-4
LVGSIGVVGGKLSLAELTEDAGIHAYVLQRGKRAAWATPVRPWNETERKAFEALLRDTYERFLDRVATGRKMDRQGVLAAAEGRVMTAQDGKELGLIDEMAGLGKALERARAAAGLGPDAPVEIWPPTQGVIDAIADLLSGDGDGARDLRERWLWQQAFVGALPVGPWIGLLEVVAQEHLALVPPYLFTLR